MSITWSTLRSSSLGRSTSISILATGTMTYRRQSRTDHRFQPHSRTFSFCCRAFDGIVPPHFYGVMAKTELGCQVLQQKGHFGEFAQFIKKHGLEQEDPDIILKLKSTIWAVVNDLSLGDIRPAFLTSMRLADLTSGKHWSHRGWTTVFGGRGGYSGDFKNRGEVTGAFCPRVGRAGCGAAGVCL